MLQLFLETRKDGGIGWFGVVDLGIVAVVIQMAGADKAVAAWGWVSPRSKSVELNRTVIPWPARDQNVLAIGGWMDFVDCSSAVSTYLRLEGPY